MRVQQLLNDLSVEVEEMTATELQQKMEAEDSLLLIDIRESEEVALGKVKGAQAMSKGVLECKIETIAPDAEQEIVLYCRSGNRSLISAYMLNKMGYGKVKSLRGGIMAWQMIGGALES